MPNPRSVIRHDDNNQRTDTFKIDGTTIAYSATAPGGAVGVNRAVSLTTADDTVELAADNAVVFGKLLKVEADGFCTVQIGGFCDLPGGASATLTIGARIIGALDGASARGFIKALPETVSASPTQAEVQNAFKAAKTRGMIVNNDDTTAVMVDLGSA